MTDLSSALYARTALLLEAQRADLARSAELLEGQRAALRSNDLDLLAEVACQAAHLLQRMAGVSRHLTVLNAPLGETTGPRSDTLRKALAALKLDLDRMFSEVRQFTEQAVERRGSLVRELRELTGTAQSHPGSSFRVEGPDSVFLDRSG